MGKQKRVVFRVLPLHERPKLTGRLLGWRVTRTDWPKGDSRDYPRSQGYTKRHAVECAVSSAKAVMPAQVVIHGRDGRILEERTYGADPRRTKG